MPKIAEKQTVLNGRGSVVRFASGTSVGNFVYREWDNSIRNYRTKHILEAKSLEEAIAMAPQIAIELAQDLANKPRNPINIDPLNLIAREEKLQRDKEKLFLYKLQLFETDAIKKSRKTKKKKELRQAKTIKEATLIALSMS